MSATEGCISGCDARERYADGRNCAEAVLGSVSSASGMPRTPDTVGAGFTGGIGHSGCVCGALVGGVAALGQYATTAGLEPVATRMLAEELSAELHARFIRQYAAACCRVIKRGQVRGSDEWLGSCSELTEWTAAATLGIIAEHAGAACRPRWAGLDALSAARRASLGVLAGGAAALAAGAVAPSAAREIVAPAAGIALALVAVLAEVSGSVARRAGRVLRVAGAIAGAALAIAFAVAPGKMVALVLPPLLADSPPSLLLRGALALAALVAAGVSAYGLKRYR